MPDTIGNSSVPSIRSRVCEWIPNGKRKHTVGNFSSLCYSTDLAFANQEAYSFEVENVCGSPQRSCRPHTVPSKVQVRHAIDVADGAGCTMVLVNNVRSSWLFAPTGRTRRRREGSNVSRHHLKHLRSMTHLGTGLSVFPHSFNYNTTQEQSIDDWKRHWIDGTPWSRLLASISSISTDWR